MLLALALSLSFGAPPSPAYCAQVDAHLKAALTRASQHAAHRPNAQREGRTPRPVGR